MHSATKIVCLVQSYDCIKHIETNTTKVFNKLRIDRKTDTLLIIPKAI